MLGAKIICLLSCIVLCIADTENLIDKTGYTSTDMCAKENGIAKVCLQCGLLPFYATPSLETCCSDESAFLLCEACVNDKDSCETLMNELEEIDSLPDEYLDESGDQDSSESDSDNFPTSDSYENIGSVDKRFGRLFVNRNPKRYGTIFFGKRSEGNINEDRDEREKRFGRIVLGRGSYFGKRSDMDKRYGRLFTNSKSYFGKRSQPYESVDQDEPELGVDKRYGRVYMGNRRNKLYGKRYGRLFFGKRSNDNEFDKRYGTLHMNKRFGRLFTGRKKYYFGK